AKRMATARPAEELLAGVVPRLDPVPGEAGRAVAVRPASPQRGLLDGLLESLLGGGAKATPRAVEVTNPEQRPHRTHGRVFFTLGGSNYYCSATVVNAKTRRLVVTAGHCAYDAGRF